MRFRRPFGRHLCLPAYALIASASVMAVATMTAVAVTAAAEPASATPLVAAAPAAEPIGQADAMRLAWKTRKPVEIVAERTESSETFANPDGTLRTRQYAAPVRVKRGVAWVPVDETLQVDGGVVRPKATTLDVRFSAGGDVPMLTVVRDGRSLAMSWPDEFPDLRPPALDGNTATYREVLPGVDLLLAAQVDSFSQVLVVKTPVAAANSALQRLRFGLATGGVTVSSDATGFIKAVTPEGVPVFVSDGARMWDKPQVQSTPAAGRAPAAANTPSHEVLPQDPEPRRVEDVPVLLDGTSLTVIPSQAMLTDPDTVRVIQK